MQILCDGTILNDKFNYREFSYLGRYNWWNYSYVNTDVDEMYIDDLKSVAKFYGYDPETIDELVEGGFSPEEIEEYIYCME